jgi:hypothetical protein
MSEIEKRTKKQEYNRRYREKSKNKKGWVNIVESDNESDVTVIVHDVVNPVINPTPDPLPNYDNDLSQDDLPEEEVTRITPEALEEYIQKRIQEAMWNHKPVEVAPPVSLKPKEDVAPSFFFQIMRNVGVSMMSTLSNVAVVALVGGAVGMISKMAPAQLNSPKSITSTPEPSTQQQSNQPREPQPVPFDPSKVQYASLF